MCLAQATDGNAKVRQMVRDGDGRWQAVTAVRVLTAAVAHLIGGTRFIVPHLHSHYAPSTSTMLSCSEDRGSSIINAATIVAKFRVSDKQPLTRAKAAVFHTLGSNKPRCQRGGSPVPWAADAAQCQRSAPHGTQRRRTQTLERTRYCPHAVDQTCRTSRPCRWMTVAVRRARQHSKLLQARWHHRLTVDCTHHIVGGQVGDGSTQ